MSERLPRKRGGAQGTPGRTPTPWQCTLSHACHAKRSGGPQGDAQGVHLTPWQCTLCHACHAKEAETQGTPGRTSDPLAVHIVPRLPRKRGGAQGTPGRTPTPLAVHIVPRLPRKRGGAQGTPGRTSDPLAVHIVPTPATQNAHCLTPATQKKRRPKGRQGVHSDPLGSAHCATPATQKRRRPKGRPGRTSDPLAVHIVPTRATQKRRRPKGRQGVHPMHIVPRLPLKRGGDPRDARAYIRPAKALALVEAAQVAAQGAAVAAAQCSALALVEAAQGAADATAVVAAQCSALALLKAAQVAAQWAPADPVVAAQCFALALVEAAQVAAHWAATCCSLNKGKCRTLGSSNSSSNQGRLPRASHSSLLRQPSKSQHVRPTSLMLVALLPRRQAKQKSQRF